MAAGVRRKKKHRSSGTKSSRYVKYGWPGLLAGLALGIMIMNSMNTGRMFVSEKSPYGFDRTVTAIEMAIPNLGFSHLDTFDAKQTLGLGSRVKVIRLLDPRGTGSAVDKDRRIACVVPAAVAVYEDEDQNVRISYLRPSRARKIFGKTTADVLGSLADEALGAE